MVKEICIIKMGIFNMKEISSKVNLKEAGNIFMKMEIIMKVNLKIICAMEKGLNMIKKEMLLMKGIGLMMNFKKKKIIEY